MCLFLGFEERSPAAKIILQRRLPSKKNIILVGDLLGQKLGDIEDPLRWRNIRMYNAAFG
jgi:hypothetical protein